MVGSPRVPRPTPLGSTCFPGLALLVLAALFPAAAAQAQPQPVIAGYQKVSEVRVTRTITEFTYRAILINGPGALTGATAVATSLSPATTILDGELTFGPVQAGRQVRSTDTFSFRQDRRAAFAWANIKWTVTPIGADRPPTITPSVAPPPNGNGWNNTPVTVSFVCADPDGNLASCSPPVTVTIEGAGQVITGTARDISGLMATASVTVNLDRTPPTVSPTRAPGANGAGWNNGPVVVSFDATDALSGVAPGSLTPPVTLAAEGANQSASGQATDLAGNVGVTTLAGINIDLTPPTILVTLSGPLGVGGTYVGPVTAHFTCTDALSGVATCPGDLTVPGPGVGLTVSGTATDGAGNSASITSLPFTIEISPGGDPPSISSSVSPPPNENGWHRTPVTVTFLCSPGGAPIVVSPAPIVVPGEGAGQIVSGTCVDSAGRQATATVTLNIDLTPPLFVPISPADGSTLYVPTPLLRGSVTDALSGLASATCNGVVATLIGTTVECTPTLEPGANAIQVVLTDRAGNTSVSPLSFVYRRVPTITLTAPSNLSYQRISPITVSGTVSDPVATVTVNSIAAPVAGGTFTLALPISEGPNTITAVATTPDGATGTASIEVTLDTTPPHVTVTSPPNQFVTTESTVSVAGIVNDIVVGTVNPEQAQVTVKGVPAQVANRTFLATNVPLALGLNVLEVVGQDRSGNEATTQVSITREAVPAEPLIRVVSGNNQSARIGQALPAPLVMSVTTPDGTPVPGTSIIVKVTANDGLVTAGEAPAPTVVATTDAAGRAQVRWRLGMRAGAGGNALEAYAVGISGTALFTATGTLGPAGKIVVDTGNDQIGAIGQPLPKPLIAVVIDDGNNRLGGVPVTFTASEGGGNFNGEPSVTLISDPDGRVAATLTLGLQEGNANNLVSATFEGNAGFPAAFSASGRAPGDPAKTTISGVILDNSNLPIAGVTVRAVTNDQLVSAPAQVAQLPAVQTDAQGQFTITRAPVGFAELLIDGTTAPPAGTYPSLEYELVTVAGQNNTVGLPIYLLPIQTANELCVTDTTGGGTLTIPEAPGFSLTFSPGQVTFPGGSKTGCVSVTVVNREKVPMVPGFGQQPRFIVTIQPAGAVFNPPAAITLPNVDGLARRSVTEMYSFDHDISSFVAIGTGTVSDDGQVIRSNPGVGVLKAGWHCGGDPTPTGNAAQCPACQTCVGAQCVPDDGNVPPLTPPPCKRVACSSGGIIAVPDPSQDGRSCESGGTCLAGVCQGVTPCGTPGIGLGVTAASCPIDDGCSQYLPCRPDLYAACKFFPYDSWASCVRSCLQGYFTGCSEGGFYRDPIDPVYGANIHLACFTSCTISAGLP